MGQITLEYWAGNKQKSEQCPKIAVDDMFPPAKMGASQVSQGVKCHQNRS
jgi:hypothetical protein